MESQSQVLSVIKVWAAVVWADGSISRPEAASMKRLINVAELTDSEREQALGYLERPVTMDAVDGELKALPASSREGIYRAAVRLAAVDEDIADGEVDFLLDKLRTGLGIDTTVAEQIEDSVASDH